MQAYFKFEAFMHLARLQTLLCSSQVHPHQRVASLESLNSAVTGSLSFQTVRRFGLN